MTFSLTMTPGHLLIKSCDHDMTHNVRKAVHDHFGDPLDYEIFLSEVISVGTGVWSPVSGLTGPVLYSVGDLVGLSVDDFDTQPGLCVISFDEPKFIISRKDVPCYSIHQQEQQLP